MAEKVVIIDRKGKTYDVDNPLPNSPQTSLVKVPYDDWQLTQPDPSPTVEEYKYFLQGKLVATVTLTYSDASKALLIRAQVV